VQKRKASRHSTSLAVKTAAGTSHPQKKKKGTQKQGLSVSLMKENNADCNFSTKVKEKSTAIGRKRGGGGKKTQSVGKKEKHRLFAWGESPKFRCGWRCKRGRGEPCGRLPHARKKRKSPAPPESLHLVSRKKKKKKNWGSQEERGGCGSTS